MSKKCMITYAMFELLERVKLFVTTLKICCDGKPNDDVNDLLASI